MSGFAWLAVFLGILFGWALGWVHAHRTVATECRRLGRFYVDKAVFHCVEITSQPTQTPLDPD